MAPDARDAERTHQLEHMTSAQRRALVDALLQCPTMNDPGARNVVVQDLPGAIKDGYQQHASSQIDVNNLVARCLNYEGGVARLLAIVRHYEGDSIPMRGIITEQVVRMTLMPVR